MPAHAAAAFSIARRRLAFAIALAGAGCAQVPGAAAERIVDGDAGRAVTRRELLTTLRARRFVLLGEVHDNPWHHRLRAGLLAELAPRTVVAEPLPRGARVGEGTDLLARLQAAGFDARAWDWPLHRPVFEQALGSGATLVGGNAPPALVRQVARQGPSTLPAEIRDLLESAPLSAEAITALERDLLEGHCGKLPAERMPSMRSAQRARDASLWLTLRDALGPAVLLAGNGHVRRDYGVPQLMGRFAADSVSVGFVETGAALGAMPFDFVWVTPAAERADPCGRL